MTLEAFGMLRVITSARPGRRGCTRVVTECACGARAVRRLADLRYGTASCVRCVAGRTPQTTPRFDWPAMVTAFDGGETIAAIARSHACSPKTVRRALVHARRLVA